MWKSLGSEYLIRVQNLIKSLNYCSPLPRQASSNLFKYEELYHMLKVVSRNCDSVASLQVIMQTF